MNSVSHNRGLFLIIRTVWNLGSGFYTDPEFQREFCSGLEHVAVTADNFENEIGLDTY